MLITVLLYLAAVSIALAAGVVWRMRRIDRKPRALLSIVAIAASLLLILAARSQVDDRTATASKPRSANERLALLENSLRAIEDGERESPRDRWDADYLVQKLGKDPDVLLNWARENTAWIPYRGVLRGPIGVLMDRQGNSLDRALLLANLLEKAGHTVRLAHANLSRTQAIELLPALVSQPLPAAQESVVDDDDPVVSIAAAAAEYQLDPASIEQKLGAQANAIQQLFVELRERSSNQTQRLLRDVTRRNDMADWTARFEKAVDAASDHWLVQREDAGQWIDLDILDPKPAAEPTEFFTTTEIPAELNHELTVKVVAEQLTPAALKETSVLEHTFRPSELRGETIALQFWPASWPKQLHPDPGSRFGLKGQALEQREWFAALAIGNNTVAHGRFGEDGEAAPPAANPYGGLGAGIIGAVTQAAPASSGELTAAWIDYQIRAPGESPHIIRRAIFDLLGPASRAEKSISSFALDETKRLTRSLALMMRTEILPVTSKVSPDFVTHLGAESLLANREVLRTIVKSLSTPDDIEPDSILARAAPAVSSLYPLAFARLDWSRHSDRIYVDQIGLLTRHRHFGLLHDDIALRGAIEIVAKDIGVSLLEPDAFSIRLEQGVLDTNAEALWWAGEGLNNTAEAYNSSKDWVTLGGDQSDNVDRLELSLDARHYIKQDLAARLLVVAPKQPVQRGPDTFVGWWRIDPLTGATTGTASNGWAQCGTTEESVHLRIAIEAAKGFDYEYVLCHEMAQAANAFKYVASELRTRGLFFYNGAIDVADPKSVFWNSNGGCMIGAMFAGLLSTLPFFAIAPQPYRFAAARGGSLVAGGQKIIKGSAWRRFWRNTMGSGRMPPALVKGPVRIDPKPTLPSIQIPKGAKTVPKGNPVTLPLGEAQANYARARQASADAIGALARYNFKHGASPTDPAFVGLERVATQKLSDLGLATKQLKQAKAAANKAAGRGGFPPPAPNQSPPAPKPSPPPQPRLPGCPPNCGNEKPTIEGVPSSESSAKLAAGSSGASSSFSK
jgi:hypothetical protein